MDLQNCNTALFVKDIEVSRDFYATLLNLPVSLDLGKYVMFKHGFSLWEIRDSHVIFQQPGIPSVESPAANRFELFFETWNLMEVYGKLKSKKVEFLHEIVEEEWGQLTMRFFDPDRHLIEVGEFMEQYVNRMRKDGMTADQISAKTHIPFGELKKFIMGL